MIAYLDSSVLLRLVLGQRNALKEWRTIEQGVASAVVEVECLRTLDRLRLAERLGDDQIALRREAVYPVPQNALYVGAGMTPRNNLLCHDFKGSSSRYFTG